MSAGINVEFTETGHGRLIDALNRTGVYAERAGAQVDRLGERTQRAGRAATEATRGFSILNDTLGRNVGTFGMLQGAISSLLTVMGVGAIITYADAYTGLESKLKLVTKTQGDTNKAMEATFGIAQKTRTSWDSIVPIYAKVVEGLKGVHGSSKDAVAITTTLAQAVALGGSSAESAKAGLYQFQQGLASGVLRGEEFNSVMENTPGLARALALGVDGANGSLGRLRNMANNGLLTTNVLIKGLEKVAPTVGKAFAQVTPTVSQSMQVLENAFQRWIGQMNSAVGFTGFLSKAIILLSNNLNIVIPILAAFGAMLATVAATFILLKFAEAIVQIRLLTVALTTLLAPMAGIAASAALTAGSVALLTASYLAATAAVVAGYTALYTLYTTITGGNGIIGSFIWLVEKLYRGLVNIGIALYKWATTSPLVYEVVMQIYNIVNAFLKVVTILATKLWEWIKANETIQATVGFLVTLVTNFTNNLKSLWDWVSNLATKFWEWIKSLDITGKALTAVSAIADKLGLSSANLEEWTKKLNIQFGGLGNTTDKAGKSLSAMDSLLKSVKTGEEALAKALEKRAEKQNELNKLMGTPITAKYDSDLKKIVYTMEDGAFKAGTFAAGIEKVNKATTGLAAANSNLSSSLNNVASDYGTATSAANNYASAALAATEATNGFKMAFGEGLGDYSGAVSDSASMYGTGGSPGWEGGSSGIETPAVVEYNGVTLAQAFPTDNFNAMQDSLRATVEWQNYLAMMEQSGAPVDVYTAQQAFKDIVGKYSSLRDAYGFLSLPYVQPTTPTTSGLSSSTSDLGLPSLGTTPSTPNTQTSTPNMWTSQSSTASNGGGQSAGNVFNFNFPNTDRDAFRRTDRQHLQTFARNMQRVAVA